MALAWFAGASHAGADIGAKPGPLLTPAADVFASPAKAWLDKKPANSAEPPRPVDKAARHAAPELQRIDEIRVYGASEAEDYVAPKLTPMMAFRAKLDRQRPMTPSEIAQSALCIIGLCGGKPAEVSAEQRTEARVRQSGVPGFGQGTLQ
jgi:hypothetical protein